jgi:hypothetical protein
MKDKEIKWLYKSLKFIGKLDDFEQYYWGVYFSNEKFKIPFFWRLMVKKSLVQHESRPIFHHDEKKCRFFFYDERTSNLLYLLAERSVEVAARRSILILKKSGGYAYIRRHAKNNVPRYRHANIDTEIVRMIKNFADWWDVVTLERCSEVSLLATVLGGMATMITSPRYCQWLIKNKYFIEIGLRNKIVIPYLDYIR